MVMGGAAGTLASSLCYPLDTIRRRMQMVGRVYDGQLDAFATIWREVLARLLNVSRPAWNCRMPGLHPVHKHGC